MPLAWDEIEEILSSGRFDRFIGQAESEILECKREPYRLELDKGAFELAKDVAAFANASGGFLVVGLETERTESSALDIVARVRPLGADKVDSKQYADNISSWVFPKPNVSITWFPSAGQPAQGLFVIKVPKHPESEKPFLIARLLDSSEKRIEIAFGYAERKESSAQPTSVHEMHSYFKHGKHFVETIGQRLDVIEAHLKSIGRATPRQPPDVSKALQRVVETPSLAGKRVLTLLAYPEGDAELKTIFDRSEGSLLHSLENPPYTRYEGWHLGAHHTAKIVEAELVRVARDDFVVDLYRNGLFVFAASGEADYYGWGVPYPRLNHLAVAEGIFNFTNFYGLLIKDLADGSTTVVVTINIRNFHKDGVRAFLSPDRAHCYEAPKDSWQTTIRMSHEEVLNPGRGAYRAVREIYLWCGADESAIPYKRREGESFVIDPSMFQRK